VTEAGPAGEHEQGGSGGTNGRGTRTRVTLTEISSRAWEHPADRGALTALRQLRGFDYLLRKLAGLWNERALRLVYIGSSVRVDHRQFARLHLLYTEAATSLDVRRLPDLYVIADPVPQAVTLGIDQPFVVLTSGMVDLLDDDDELRFVLGHELGHVLSGHAVYTTMLIQLLRVSLTLSWLPFGTLGMRAIIAALYEWRRKAELSSDRAGLLASQDPPGALRVHMKLAGGGKIDDLDIAAFRAQGEEYLASPDVRDSVLRLLLLEARSHPFAVVRAAELQRWVDDGSYTRILRGNYPRRSEDANATVQEDTKEATRHYRQAFERSQDPLVSLVRDVGGGLANVRDWATGWLRGGPRDRDADGGGNGDGDGEAGGGEPRDTDPDRDPDPRA
jgi:Zn-dependent protease with chaperone function